MEQKLKVLIVEDDNLILASLEHRFTDAGYEVHTALDGEAGFDAYKAVHPDALVTDIRLPKKDGLSLLEDIRKEEAGKTLPIVVLTNSDDLSHVAHAVEHNVAAYLPKSDQDIDMVVSVINKKLKKD